MEQANQNVNFDNSIYSNTDHLKPQCEKCFGLCCVALYFSKLDGFPTDKSAGTPCPNLCTDFRCSVHEKLSVLGLKGCINYDCLGAGQQVSQVTFAGRSWKLDPPSAELMFEAFLIMRQLHEMCWYLTEALSFQLNQFTHKEILEALRETEHITRLPLHSLIQFNLPTHQTKIYRMLSDVSKVVRNEFSHTFQSNFNINKRSKLTVDFFGKDLRKKELRGADLRGACLIAANLEGVDLSGTDFIGADLRDTNLKAANLSRSIFLTQSQINAANGDSNTKLPASLIRPNHWE